MSLNNIQLSDITCQMLFEKNLVENTQMNAGSQVSNQFTISSLGENQKSIFF